MNNYSKYRNKYVVYMRTSYINLRSPDRSPQAPNRDSGYACITRPILTFETLSQSSESINGSDSPYPNSMSILSKISKSSQPRSSNLHTNSVDVKKRINSSQGKYKLECKSCFNFTPFNILSPDIRNHISKRDLGYKCPTRSVSKFADSSRSVESLKGESNNNPLISANKTDLYIGKCNKMHPLFNMIYQSEPMRCNGTMYNRK